MNRSGKKFGENKEKIMRKKMPMEQKCGIKRRKNNEQKNE